jgi:hypothetical protein
MGTPLPLGRKRAPPVAVATQERAPLRQDEEEAEEGGKEGGEEGAAHGDDVERERERLGAVVRESIARGSLRTALFFAETVWSMSGATGIPPLPSTPSSSSANLTGRAF